MAFLLGFLCVVCAEEWKDAAPIYTGGSSREEVVAGKKNSSMSIL